MSNAAKLRDAIVAILHEHELAGALPTSARFLFYELVARGIVSKASENKRRADQDLIDALTVLREKGIVPWSWITDETRAMANYTGAFSIQNWVEDRLAYARLDPWSGDAPLILTESRSLAGVLQGLASEYATWIAATNGQTNGFLHNDVAPALSEGVRVIYLGDFDFAGGHIEANTRRVLEREVGPLAWERLALTEDQVMGYDLTVIDKIDNRHKPPRSYPSVETEALSQTIIVEIVRDRLDELLPEPLERVQEREAAERTEILGRIRE